MLCKGKLSEYLDGLRPDFFEFSVQRKIVNNVYLDNIYQSVEKGEPFPPITLMYSESIECTKTEVKIDVNKVEILDGLQRTYRLWVVMFFYKIIRDSKASDLQSLATAAKRTPEGEVVLQNSFITPTFIKSLFRIKKDDIRYIDDLVKKYAEFDVYFNIWTGLNDEDVIRRMLVLNAGQKAVSSTHQFELLFLHFFEDERLQYNSAVKLVREKDKRYRDVQRGKRDIGEYLMSSVVIALQSFINGKQLRISPTNMINLDDDKLLNDLNLTAYFNVQTLSKFINCLYALDKNLAGKSADYIKWFGKDTTLSGVFGAMGAFLINSSGGFPKVEEIYDLISQINKKEDPFNLKEFYDAYENKLVSTKVNLGNAVRKTIFNYTKNLLDERQPDWYQYFSQYSDNE